MLIARSLQTVAQTIQKLIQAQTECPKTANGFCGMQLVMIAAHQFHKVSK